MLSLLIDFSSYVDGQHELENGDTIYIKDGKLHREDGPAFSSKIGYYSWYLNGKLHREDGPAITFTNVCENWCLYGIWYTNKEEYGIALRKIRIDRLTCK